MVVSLSSCIAGFFYHSSEDFISDLSFPSPIGTPLRICYLFVCEKFG